MGRQLITPPLQGVIYTLAGAKQPDTQTKAGILRYGSYEGVIVEKVLVSTRVR